MKNKLRFSVLTLTLGSIGILITGWTLTSQLAPIDPIRSEKVIRTENRTSPESKPLSSDGDPSLGDETLSIRSLVQSLRSESVDKIRAMKIKASRQIDQRRLIERANRGELSPQERLGLKKLLAQYHAAVIAEWEHIDENN